LPTFLEKGFAMNREQLIKKLLGYKNELKEALIEHDQALAEFCEEMLVVIKQQLKLAK